MQCGDIKAVSRQVISSIRSGIIALVWSYLLFVFLLDDGVEVEMQG